MRPLRLSSMNLIVYEGLSLTAIVWERSDCRYRLTTTQLTRNGRHSCGKSEPKKFMGADGTVIQLYDDLIACGDEQHKLDGVHASVEDSSAFESRVTSIRMLAVGLLAFAFQKSGGEKYLTVESPTLRGQPQLIVSRYLTRWDLRPLLMILRENCCGYAKKGRHPTFTNPNRCRSDTYPRVMYMTWRHWMRISRLNESILQQSS